jgi:hypothetical protein
VKHFLGTLVFVASQLAAGAVVGTVVLAHTGWAGSVCVGLAALALVANWGVAAFIKVAKDWACISVLLAPSALAAGGAAVQGRAVGCSWPVALGGAVGAALAPALTFLAVAELLVWVDYPDQGTRAAILALQFAVAVEFWQPFVRASTLAWWGWLAAHFVR